LHCVKNRDALKSVADEIRSLGSTGDILQFDIADRAATQAALTAWVEANGAPFGVVLNAGIADDAPFPGLEDDQWDRVLRTDLDGFYNVLKPLVLPMVQARTRGRIIALSSISGVIGNRGQTNYSAAKAGIIGAAKALAVELARRNITVNCVAPGVIETEMIEGVFAEEAMKMIPMRRFGKPEEVAAVVKFLLSEEAAYITRQVIQVNGGMF
jgi:3-oxoacyl-[acyl-carrier protein] reductase